MPKGKWSYCHKCKVEKGFFDVLSIFHKYKKGSASMFLGQEYFNKVKWLKTNKTTPLKNLDEVLVFTNYKFDSSSLVSIDIESVVKVSEQLLKLQ